VQIKINRKQRVGKYGRLLGRIIQGGIDIGEQSIVMGHAKRFDNKDEAKIPDINKMFRGI